MATLNWRKKYESFKYRVKLFIKLLLCMGSLERLLFYKELAAMVNFLNTWKSMKHILPLDNQSIISKFNYAKKNFQDPATTRNRILNIICDNKKVYLAKGILEYTDNHSLWTLIHEILLDEDYYFESSIPTPYILDCGTHVGMSIYYFKTLYPEAKIVGFEPEPRLRDMALKNIQVNNYKNVEILPYAISDKEEKQKFHISKDQSMASSLTERRIPFDHSIETIDVECRKLSTYLNQPVHFLKLDVEGVEDLVLEESKSLLKNVKHLFCEYHHSLNQNESRLAKILSLLEECHFDVHLQKSYNNYLNTKYRPLNHINEIYSLSIWAKNREWKTD